VLYVEPDGRKRQVSPEEASRLLLGYKTLYANDVPGDVGESRSHVHNNVRSGSCSHTEGEEVDRDIGDPSVSKPKARGNVSKPSGEERIKPENATRAGRARNKHSKQRNKK
jgi:hypothetical protein